MVRGPASPRQLGFTILELLVVMTILGIAVLMLMPRLDVRLVKVNATSRSLTMFVLAAQQRAVLSQHNVLLVFDTAHATLILHEDVNNDGERDNDERARTYIFEEGVKFTRGVATAGPPGPLAVNITRTVGGLPVVTFHRNGTASENAGFYIGTARSQTSNAYLADVRGFTLDRGTGQVVRWVQVGGAWQREAS